MKTLDLVSEPSRSWPYGVNVDNLMILDFDADAILSHVEILIPVARWHVEDPFPALPRTRQSADVRLAQPSRHAFITSQVLGRTNTDRSSAIITFGLLRNESKAVELSSLCHALIEEDYLIGFAVCLKSQWGG